MTTSAACYRKYQKKKKIKSPIMKKNNAPYENGKKKKKIAYWCLHKNLKINCSI